MRLRNHQTQSHEHCSFQVLISHMFAQITPSFSCPFSETFWNTFCPVTITNFTMRNWTFNWSRNIQEYCFNYGNISRSLSIPLDFYFVKSQFFLMTSPDGKWHHFGGKSAGFDGFCDVLWSYLVCVDLFDRGSVW